MLGRKVVDEPVAPREKLVWHLQTEIYWSIVGPQLSESCFHTACVDGQCPRAMLPNLQGHSLKKYL